MTPSPALLEQLSTSRFLVDLARPSVGVGERRSATKGAGMEFADYRPYQPGDDIRHLDLRLRERLGENFIRQYAVDRQLPITILLDTTASMAHGEPDKLAFAKQLAQLMGFVGLAAGDRVQVVAFADGRLEWSPRWQGPARAELLFGWIAQRQPAGAGSFAQALSLVARDLPAASLLILISDWWTEDVEAQLATLGAARQELIGLHVASPQELDPVSLGTGLVYMVDSESGEEVELMLDAETLADYKSAYAQWRETLAGQFARRQGRYFPISSADDVEHFFLRQLRGAGVIA